jgi:hypothetical protein
VVSHLGLPVVLIAAYVLVTRSAPRGRGLRGDPAHDAVAGCRAPAADGGTAGANGITFTVSSALSGAG